MQGLQGDGYRVLGITIDGPAPLGRIHLDLSPGLSVLYGLNGAGKTRLLAAIAALLQGRALERGLGLLHLKVDHPAAVPEEGFLKSLQEGLAGTTLVEGPALGSGYENLGSLDAERSFIELAAEHLSSMETDWEYLDVAVHEASRSGYFSLEAVGLTRSLWRIWISNRLDGESPLDHAYQAVGPAVRESASLIRKAQAGSRSQEELGELARQMYEIGLEIAESSPWHLPHPALHDLRREFLFDRPSWVPLELVSAGRIAVGPLDVVRVEDGAPDHDGRTATRLLPTRQFTLHETQLFRDGGATELSGEVAARVAQLEQAATDSFRSVIGPGPSLRFLLGSPTDWFLGTQPAWVCDDEYGNAVPIPQLSTFRRRWAAAAIELALGGDVSGDVPSVVLSDEPEAGVHRTGEAQVVSGMCRLTAGAHRSGIVATHSPTFFCEPTVRLLHVRRDVSGSTEVRAVAGMPDDDDYGLTKADLLALRRVFVIVEGEHDRIVLSSLFRTELQRSFAQILVLRGGKHASALAHAEWLLGATDAPLLLVLDNLAEAGVRAAFDEARSHANSRRFDDALNAVRDIKNVSKDEAGFLFRLAQESLRTGTFDRLHFFGLSEADILAYLPDGARLIKAKRQGALANAEVEAIVRTLDSIPTDLTRLIEEIGHLGATFGRRQSTLP